MRGETRPAAYDTELHAVNVNARCTQPLSSVLKLIKTTLKWWIYLFKLKLQSRITRHPLQSAMVMQAANFKDGLTDFTFNENKDEASSDSCSVCVLAVTEVCACFIPRDLSNNQISEIAPDAFHGLRALNSLWVTHRLSQCVCVSPPICVYICLY